MHHQSGKIAVVALGGNAITREFEEGDIYQQFANTRQSLVGVAELIEFGYRLAITHGNGPQVGNALIRVEATRDLLPPIPLGVLVADLEGGMGYMIEQSLQNKLHKRGIQRPVVTLLAQVIVDKNDPSILNPSKFVGPFYRKEETASLENNRNYTLKDDSGRGYRRVVPSPLPRAIVEIETIKALVHAGTIVITAGGGGIPVYIEDDGRYEGLDAVVDKDRTSAILAADINADELYILTSVDKVALNYRQPNMTYLDRMSKGDAKTYLEQGHFPPGNMGPKIEAAIHFLEHGGKRAVITSIDKMSNAIRGETGTEIVS
ncbi:carbamate kinase [candidate division KSB1 bacterium]|nr:carbamate kinase [candidate division KSB1 bacterium]RQW01203.1 MAG: carbamate kinase [candidate division KSB1 bacterium]